MFMSKHDIHNLREELRKDLLSAVDDMASFVFVPIRERYRLIHTWPDLLTQSAENSSSRLRKNIKNAIDEIIREKSYNLEQIKTDVDSIVEQKVVEFINNEKFIDDIVQRIKDKQL